MENYKLESLYHFLMIENGYIGSGTLSSNNKLKELLLKHKSLEEVYDFKKGPLFKEDITKRKDLEKIIKKLSNQKFKILNINNYPEYLKDIDGLTPVLYVKGDLSLLEQNTIAVVGTRNLESQEIIKEASEIVKELVNNKYIIVSGLALGSDTLAHKEAIKNKGKTIAVIGTPINKNYPLENKLLQEQIAKEHLLVSQYPIGITTFPNHFAYRNLTTVSLAKEGILVIQADDLSGTKHAIRFCIEQGKQVFALKNNKIYNWYNDNKGAITLI